jgi:hypothetical protein
MYPRCCHFLQNVFVIGSSSVCPVVTKMNDRSHILLLEGESYPFHKRLEKQAQVPAVP